MARIRHDGQPLNVHFPIVEWTYRVNERKFILTLCNGSYMKKNEIEMLYKRVKLPVASSVLGAQHLNLQRPKLPKIKASEDKASDQELNSFRIQGLPQLSTV
ncbi:hypothetical protein E3N88_23643 [Mikania micrantha]|uniref:Uncharacterized protein n=1 Tax=Mikania micrantha TaxID=192012 RepID=A0A5N6NDX1_9ASTR|nr:hypothetical protein E3N88_23643 [Mikania micrantha]